MSTAGHVTATTAAEPLHGLAGLMRPSELSIVHLTPNQLAQWSKPNPSPGFRSPAPWLSRSVPSPLPRDEKNPNRWDSGSERLPPRYSRYRPDRRSRLPPRYTEDAAVSPEVLFSDRRRAVQEFLSEMMGTFIMIMFGDGVVAQSVLSKETKGDFQSINWGWGVAVMMGVFVARRSGGHLNPAVTFANCVYRGFPWYKFPYYTVAQVLGAMLGAVVVYANYISAIDLIEGGSGIRTINATAGVFSTYPVPFISTKQQFFSEFLASAILMFSIFSLVDAGLGNILPLFLLFLIFGIGAAFGWETGYAMNLARDFGPRLMCFFVGYGDAVFTASGSYFWIPIIAPFFGTVSGGLLYDVLVHAGDSSPIHMPWNNPSEPV